jgi:hypothetical protein
VAIAKIQAASKKYLGSIRDHLLSSVEKADTPDYSRLVELLAQLPEEERRQYLQAIEDAISTMAEFGVEAALKQIENLLPSGSDPFKQANEEAIAWAEERSAWLVTKIDETTRENIQTLVENAEKDGLSNQELAQQLRDSEAFSDARAEMIARTETAMADVQGNLAGWKASGVVEGKQFLAAPDCCDECQAMADVVVGLDEEFPEGDPPIHPNCFLPGTLVSTVGWVSSVFERWYEGEIVRIRIEGNPDITCTPNHPILTQRGWIPAAQLTERDYLFKVSREMFSSVNPENNHVNALIEEVSNTISMSGRVSTTRMPSSTEDFHGDGTIDQEINIVRADSGLRADTRKHGGKHTKEGNFLITDSDLEAFARECNCAPMSLGLSGTTNCSMSCFDTSKPSFRSGPGSFCDMRGGTISDMKPETIKCLADGGAMATKALSNVNTALSSLITTVNIKELIVGEQFSGHVYNLETEGGWYAANDIIAHNCRCDVIAVIKEQEGEE